MAYTPPPSPGELRSSRKRALEIGTNPSGFQPANYDAQAGTPTGQTGGTYREQPPQITQVGGPINPSKPFGLK